ncbi:hypothetical protein F0562_019763 [Nyssa sinensis]|uniref:CCHC-type domain-containing protein n=1 Tax=Nyssa sinensis TaxID=561372 RepID=A0A5J5BSI2_9ASTE|nr:hypothetical protein F0562_019763 [Nyssa sinensis]
MNSGESVSDYFSRTMAIANKMRIHGDKMADVTIIEKILRSMTAKLNYVVCSIEESKDTDSMSIDELQSSLLVHEQKMNWQDKEEQALQASASKGGGEGRGKGKGKGGNDGRHSNQKSEDSDFQGRGNGHDNNINHSMPSKSKSAEKSRVECYKCHKFGHYESKCCTNLMRDGGKQSNFAKKEEEVSLLMACHLESQFQLVLMEKIVIKQTNNSNTLLQQLMYLRILKMELL